LSVSYKSIAAKSEVSEENVSIVLHSSPIRDASKVDSAKVYLVGMEFLAKTYGFEKIVPEATIQLIKMLQESYGWINYEEFLLAFRLAAAGHLNCKTSMYDGVFNLGKVGEVLNAYKVYRVRVVQAAQQLAAEAERQARHDELLSPAGRERVNMEIWKRIESEGIKIEDEGRVPGFWYDWLLNNRDDFNPTDDEKRATFAQAKIDVENNLRKERYTDKTITALFNASVAEFESTLKTKAVVLAQKRLVLKYLKQQFIAKNLTPTT
jgi:hypothetical protein